MACTFSPALVAKPKITKSEMSSTFGCLPFAFGDDDAGIGGRGKEPVHERLYSMRGRNQVKEERWCCLYVKVSAMGHAAMAWRKLWYSVRVPQEGRFLRFGHLPHLTSCGSL